MERAAQNVCRQQDTSTVVVTGPLRHVYRDVMCISYDDETNSILHLNDVTSRCLNIIIILLLLI